MAKKKKVRVELRKNRNKPARQGDLTRQFQRDDFNEDAVRAEERVRAKGDLSRHRTIITQEPTHAERAGDESADMPAVDVSKCLPGRVVRVHKESLVETDDGRRFRCAVRRVLKTLARRSSSCRWSSRTSSRT
jgi:ribosome biogenesis GTPase